MKIFIELETKYDLDLGQKESLANLIAGCGFGIYSTNLKENIGELPELANAITDLKKKFAELKGDAVYTTDEEHKGCGLPYDVKPGKKAKICCYGRLCPKCKIKFAVEKEDVE